MQRGGGPVQDAEPPRPPVDNLPWSPSALGSPASPPPSLPHPLPAGKSPPFRFAPLIRNAQPHCRLSYCLEISGMALKYPVQIPRFIHTRKSENSGYSKIMGTLRNFGSMFLMNEIPEGYKLKIPTNAQPTG